MTMDDTISAYVEVLGASPSVERRIRAIWNEYQTVIPETDAAGVFVSQQVSDESQVTYGSLWFYYKDFVGECRNFVFSDDFDCWAIPAVSYWQIRKESLDFNAEPMTNSKISLDWSAGVTRGTMNAIGDNCSELLKFHRNFVIPHFTANTLASQTEDVFSAPSHILDLD